MTLFDEQKQIVDELAKLRNPTKNGTYTVTEFTRELEAIFTMHGWTFAEYCGKVWSSQLPKRQPAVKVDEIELEKP